MLPLHFRRPGSRALPVSRDQAASPGLGTTRRSLLTGAAAGVAAGAGGSVAAGTAAGPASAATTAPPTPDWLNVLAYGADPTGMADSTKAFQNAIDAVAAKGGVVYAPGGTYKISSGPLRPVSGLRLTGDGYLSTTLTSRTSSILSASNGKSVLDSVEIDGLTLTATGSDLITGGWLARWRIHDCRLIQNSAGNAIWNAAAVTGMVECVFERNREFVYGTARTIDAWHLSCSTGSAQINQNVWRDNVCFNSGNGGVTPVYDASHYWYHLIQAKAANVNQANSFASIVFEHCCGGAIMIESAVGTVIDSCWSYDTPANSVANALFRIKKNTTGAASQLTTIRNSGRLGPGLKAGVADIALDGACQDTSIIGCGCNSANGPFVVDLGFSKSVSVTGLPVSYSLLNASGLPFGGQLPGSSPQPQDLGYLGWAYDSASLGGTGTALPAAGTVYLIKIPLRTPVSFSRVRLQLITPAAGLTSGRNFVGVYSSQGALIGSSADQTAAWQGGSGVIDAKVSGSSAVTAGPGFVWVAVLFNGTTGPALDGSPAASGLLANGRLTPATARFGSILTGQATLPASITPASIALTAAQWWAALW